ncbi:MAG: single-stranded DNA-binding protein [Planctomycetes bacterium]|nr:single-stranded DNA-binding protein [Planctomycetota bacterium]
MVNFNKVILAGNLTRDPEVNFTPGGTTITRFTIAVNEYWNDPNGGRQEKTAFIDITTFGNLAKTCGDYLKKGRSALVEGRLEQYRFEDRDTGQKRSKISVVANTVQFLGPREPGQSGRKDSYQGSGSNDSYGDYQQTGYQNNFGDNYDAGGNQGGGFGGSAPNGGSAPSGGSSGGGWGNQGPQGAPAQRRQPPQPGNQGGFAPDKENIDPADYLGEDENLAF